MFFAGNGKRAKSLRAMRPPKFPTRSGNCMNPHAVKYLPVKPCDWRCKSKPGNGLEILVHWIILPQIISQRFSGGIGAAGDTVGIIRPMIFNSPSH